MTSCQRCATPNPDQERFCWMCQWDSTKEFVECPYCGDALKDDGRCSTCGIDPVDPEEDKSTNEYPQNKR